MFEKCIDTQYQFWQLDIKMYYLWDKEARKSADAGDGDEGMRWSPAAGVEDQDVEEVWYLCTVSFHSLTNIIYMIHKPNLY